MATYKELQDWVQKKFGYQPKTCWIEDVKKQRGLPVRRALKRQSDKRMTSFPKEKVKDLKAAFRNFCMIKQNRILKGFDMDSLDAPEMVLQRV